MVIASTAIKQTTYTGNGATAFAIGFPYFNPNDLEILVDLAEKTIITDYTVANGSLSVGHYVNGTINFNVAPANGSAILIRCNTSNMQSLSFASLNTFDPALIEPVFDRVSLIVRDLERRVNDLDQSDVIQQAELILDEVQDLHDETANYRNEAQAYSAAALGQANLANASAAAAAVSATNANNSAISSAASAAQAVVTANNLAATLTGNYILPSVPSVDGSNQFTLTSQMKARMNNSFKAVLPTTGVDVTYQAWIANGTAFTWASQSCKIISTVIPIQGLGTGTFDINHQDGGELKIRYSPAFNMYVIEKIGEAAHT